MNPRRCTSLAFQAGKLLLDPHCAGKRIGAVAVQQVSVREVARGRGLASEPELVAQGSSGEGDLWFPPNRLRFHYENVLRQDLLAKFHYDNIMEVPRLRAILVVPRAAPNAAKAARVALEILCGQKFLTIEEKDTSRKVRSAKYEPKSSNKVTSVARTSLRGDLMYNFLEKLVCITSFHDHASRIHSNCVQLTMGSQLLRLFPEIVNHFEVFEHIRGVNVTVVTSAKSRDETAILWSGFLHREK